MKNISPKRIPERMHLLLGFAGGVAAVFVLQNAQSSLFTSSVSTQSPSQQNGSSQQQTIIKAQQKEIERLRKELRTADTQIKNLQSTQAPPAYQAPEPRAQKQPEPVRRAVTPAVQKPTQIPVHNIAECTKHEDCPSNLYICNGSQKCERLQDPTCSCSQANVLQCVDVYGKKARHTSCINGCTSLPSPHCQ